MLKNWSYSKLSLKRYDGTKNKGQAFVLQVYVNTDGSYASWGKHVHRTVMYRKKDS